MISVWTNQEISSILLQLEQRNLLFPGYRFCRDEGQLRLLGSGSFALVFDAADKAGQNNFCIKVVGFGDKSVVPEEFGKTIEAQKRASFLCPNIMKIYASVQLYVRLDRDNQVLEASVVKGNGQPEEDCLLLQFTVMEKLVPVLTTGRNRQPVLFPRGLAEGDEKEILKLGKHITTALTALHNNSMIHRDIKLENIFYDPRHKRYKLGDFGCAKATVDGLAATVTFTKGYGAPEIVGMPEDRYDYTADIYSLGMVLFVLMNELRFPASETYRVNPAAQYCKGYVLPAPAWGTEDVAQLLQKMCAYDPDDRPQSIQEVGAALNRLGFSPEMRRRGEGRNIMGLLGAVFLAAGIGIVLLRANYPDCRVFFDTIPWLTPLLLSLGVLFGCQGVVFLKKSLVPAHLRQRYSKLVWICFLLLYIYLIIVAKLPVRQPGTHSDFLMVTVPTVVRQLQGEKIGICGLAVCGICWLQHRIRQKRENP